MIIPRHLADPLHPSRLAIRASSAAATLILRTARPEPFQPTLRAFRALKTPRNPDSLAQNLSGFEKSRLAPESVRFLIQTAGHLGKPLAYDGLP
jgi:DNA-binding PucR family transcriptional regulator